MGVLRVADGDMAAHAFGEVFAGEDAEGTGHVGEEPGAVFVVGAEKRDAGKRSALGDGLEGREVGAVGQSKFLAYLFPGGVIFGGNC